MNSDSRSAPHRHTHASASTPHLTFLLTLPYTHAATHNMELRHILSHYDYQFHMRYTSLLSTCSRPMG